MWLRENKVDLSKYLPKFLQKDLNFQAVTQADSDEHEKIRKILQEVFAQFFVESATWGLSIYEKILDLTPKSADGYEQRRLRIFSRLQFAQTSTVEFMRELVKKYAQLNADVEIIELNSGYTFKIKVRGGSIIYLEDLVDAVNLYKPAHLGWLLSFDRPVKQKYYLGLAVRTGRKTTIKPANTFKAGGIENAAYFGGFVRIARYISIKEGERFGRL